MSQASSSRLTPGSAEWWADIRRREVAREQRSREWFEARKNRVTASEAPLLLNESQADGFEALLEKKRNPPPDVDNEDMRRGRELEQEAIKKLEEELGLKIYTDVGFIVHPDSDRFGGSPDGITEDGRVVEIKCPRSAKAFGGSVPKKNRAQVDALCQICNAKEYIFAQYAENRLNINHGQRRSIEMLNYIHILVNNFFALKHPVFQFSK